MAEIDNDGSNEDELAAERADFERPMPTSGKDRIALQEIKIGRSNVRRTQMARRLKGHSHPQEPQDGNSAYYEK